MTCRQRSFRSLMITLSPANAAIWSSPRPRVWTISSFIRFEFPLSMAAQQLGGVRLVRGVRVGLAGFHGESEHRLAAFACISLNSSMVRSAWTKFSAV